MSLFRADLLAGVRVALAGEPVDALTTTLSGLGAVLVEGEASGSADVLVVDHSGARPSGGDGLGDLLDAVWEPVHRVAAEGMIPAERAGKLVLISPRPHPGTHATAAAAGFVNLARTLSIEWARYRIMTTAITPGETTGDSEIAELVAYLCGPGGDYFTGCRIELGAIPAGR